MNDGNRKRLGMDAAKAWTKKANVSEIVKLAAYDFDYKLDTLDLLIEQGFDLPKSSDYVFSYGFWKQTKSHVTHKIFMAQRQVQNMKS